MAIEPSKFASLGKSFDKGSSPMYGIESAVLRLSNDITEELKEYFAKNNLNGSGALSNSIGGLPVTITENGAEIKIVAEDYFKFIDEGVNGTDVNRSSPYSYKDKAPPVNNIIRFMQIRNVPLMPEFKTYEQQAYAYANSIKKKGIRPRNILDGLEQDNNLEERIARSIEAALGNAVELTYVKIVSDVKPNK
jgi:hypothetical protein